MVFIAKILVLGVSMVLSAGILAFDKNDVTDKSKPIWTDFTANLYHQFVSQTPFQGLNSALCMFNNSRYQDFTNFKRDDNSEPSQAYLANLNDNECSAFENGYANIIRASQDDSESPLMIESWKVKPAMDRARLTLEEEVSEANPFGVMSVTRDLFSNQGVSLYRLTTRSEKLDNSRIQYKMSMWVDSHVVSQAIPIGVQSEFYASNIIYEQGNSGYGTVSGFGFREMSNMPFPDGTAVRVNTTNLSFNTDFFLYQETIDTLSGNSYTSAEVCLDRDSSWRYIPNFGYGIYDSNGDRFGGGTLSYDHEGSLESFSATQSSVNIPSQCKSIEDGSAALNENDCGYELSADGLPLGVALTGSENLPKFDIADGALVTGNGGESYLVRQLKPRTVYSQVELVNCAGLVLQETLATPDHNFAESLEGSVPASGALLVNAYEVGDSVGDPNYVGARYDPNEDTDGDNVPNYLDVFPDNSSKSVDADYDGIEDTVDDEVSQPTLQHPDYTNVEMQDYPQRGTRDN